MTYWFLGYEANSTLHYKKEALKYSSSRKPTNKEVAKQTLVLLEHTSGMLKSVANMMEGVPKKVLNDICFSITEQTDLLVLE